MNRNTTFKKRSSTPSWSQELGNMCRVQQFSHFLRNWSVRTRRWIQKHILKRRLTFFETFRAPLVSNCKKHGNNIQICFIIKLLKGIRKGRIWYFSEKNCKIIYSKKDTRVENFCKITDGWKSPKFLHFLLISALFQRFQNQNQILRFFKPEFNYYWEDDLFCHVGTFCYV